MTELLEIVTPVFALIALGYVAAWRKILDDAAFKGMTLFVFGLAAPALLFSGGTRPHEGGGAAALALLGTSVVFFFALIPLAQRMLKLTMAEAAVFALSCVFGNSVMMGVPIIVSAYGQAGVPPMLAILGLQTVIVLGMATMMIEVGLNAAAPWRRLVTATLMGMLRNPVVLSVFAALVWNLFGLPVPPVLRRTLDFLGGAAPPLALFCLGGGLAGIAASAIWKETAAIVAAKLFVFPALVFAAGWMLTLTAIELAVAVTMAALPTGANAFILARRYATGADRSGSAVVVSTALSVLTISALIAHFRGTLP
ncbi:AEC family transporter [Falsiroseomonas bella]|uniref:AEC family transporter n=1 Tax=Falsiroseomonas bella TaxID=2184016 RepID=A0A317F856_9PROT|nr:AEC family transporter [Falsiroseomonas bella]PWS35351.1 AEC family transporter [Falsiroseomonas bella]